MTKKEFIESYISRLETCLEKFGEGEFSSGDLFDEIRLIRGIFVGEVPEIDDALLWRVADQDAETLIGILKLHIIDEGANEMEKSNATESELEKSFRELKLEYQGVKKTIEDYTHDGNITNYLTQLGEGINSGDMVKIKYCLNAILKWYQKNISRIHSNYLVVNTESHDENIAKLKHFKKAFESTTEDFLLKPNRQPNKNEPIIFLSHKSDDKKYADALEKFITGLGVKNNQLIYTSHPLHKIPLDANIYDYLRKRINGNTFMIFLWSDKYLESPACMNEMGAAWVIQGDYTNIYVPTFSFGNPKYRECAVDTSKMGAVLNGDQHCKANMIELKNKIQSIFKLENDEQVSQYLLDTFIKEIQEIN